MVSGIPIGNRSEKEQTTSVRKQKVVAKGQSVNNINTGLTFNLPIRSQKRKATHDEEKANGENGGVQTGTTLDLPFCTKRQRKESQ